MDIDNFPDASGPSAAGPSTLRKGYGRIVRDADGNIVDVELAEEDAEEDAEEEEGHNSRRSMHDQSRSKREETLGRKRAEKDVYRKGMERKKQKAEGTQWSR